MEPHLPEDSSDDRNGPVRHSRRRSLLASIRRRPALSFAGFAAGVTIGLVVAVALAGTDKAPETSVVAHADAFCSIMSRAIQTPFVRNGPDHIDRSSMQGNFRVPWPQPNVATIVDIYSRIIAEVSALGITDSDAVDDLLEGLTIKRDQLRRDPSIYLSTEPREDLQREPAHLIGNAMFRLGDQGMVPPHGTCAALCPPGTPSSPAWTLLLYPFSVNDQRRDAPISGPVGDMIQLDIFVRRGC